MEYTTTLAPSGRAVCQLIPPGKAPELTIDNLCVSKQDVLDLLHIHNHQTQDLYARSSFSRCGYGCTSSCYCFLE